MGGNSEHKRTNQMMDQERNRQTGEHNSFMKYASPERAREKTLSDDMRGDIYGGYKGFATGDSLMRPGQSGFGSQDGFNGGMGGSGGYTPQTYNPQNAGLSGYSRQAGSTFGDMANTGGWSTGDQTNFRDRAIRTSNAFYGGLEDNFRQANANQSGGMAMTGSLARMARQKAQSGQNSLTDAEIEMQGNIRQNKLAGASGLTGVGGQENEMNQFNTNINNEASRYNIDQANSAAAAGASGSAANARWLAEQDQQERQWRADQQFRGLGGMHDMYTSTPAELGRQDDNIFRSRFGTADNNNSALGMRAQYNPKGPGLMDRAMQVAGMGAGIAGAFMGGGPKSAPSSGLSGYGGNTGYGGSGPTLTQNGNYFNGPQYRW